jgi:hypothetical protein
VGRPRGGGHPNLSPVGHAVRRSLDIARRPLVYHSAMSPSECRSPCRPAGRLRCRMHARREDA